MATQRWVVKRSFDLKFGTETAAECPACPGVYLYRDAQGAVIYVGKAKNLRRRISQYRHAKRMRKLEKTRRILKAAHSIEVRTAGTELEAELLEARLIQELRPPLNVQGAFSFMYPLVGLSWENGRLHLLRTSSEAYRRSLGEGWSWHGAYRSRFWVREALDALSALLSYLGHREPTDVRGPRVPFGFRFAWRGLDPGLVALLDAYFVGESRALLEHLALALLEKPSARRDGSRIEEHLKTLAAFHKHESRRLRQAVVATGHRYPVLQEEREALMIRARAVASRRF